MMVNKYKEMLHVFYAQSILITNLFSIYILYIDQSELDQEDIELEDHYMVSMQKLNSNVDTQRIEEIPAKEPILNAIPKKSALKKRSGPGVGTPTQENQNKPLVNLQDNNTHLK